MCVPSRGWVMRTQRRPTGRADFPSRIRRLPTRGTGCNPQAHAAVRAEGEQGIQGITAVSAGPAHLRSCHLLPLMRFMLTMIDSSSTCTTYSLLLQGLHPDKVAVPGVIPYLAAVAVDTEHTGDLSISQCVDGVVAVEGIGLIRQSTPRQIAV